MPALEAASVVPAPRHCFGGRHLATHARERATVYLPHPLDAFLSSRPDGPRPCAISRQLEAVNKIYDWLTVEKKDIRFGTWSLKEVRCGRRGTCGSSTGEWR